MILLVALVDLPLLSFFVFVTVHLPLEYFPLEFLEERLVVEAALPIHFARSAMVAQEVESYRVASVTKVLAGVECQYFEPSFDSKLVACLQNLPIIIMVELAQSLCYY